MAEPRLRTLQIRIGAFILAGLGVFLAIIYLLGAELNIRFAYPLMLRPTDSAMVGVPLDDQPLAGQILRKKNFSLLGEGDLP